MKALKLRARRTDEADVVQTVILIAGFVVIAVFIVVWLSTAILNRGVDSAKCIESENSYKNSATGADTACAGGTSKQGNNSFDKDDNYTRRY